IAALLGADEVSFGTAVLLAQGCLMVRSCHLDTCPVGIATQRPELRSKYAATPEAVESYVRFVAAEVRELLARLGLRSFGDAVGRGDLLAQRHVTERRAASIELRSILRIPRGRFEAQSHIEPEGGNLGTRLAADAAPILDEPRILDLRYDITNRDRAV